MDPRILDETALPGEVSHQESERRAFVRYPRRLESLWELLGVPANEMTTATVFDVSANGVGILSEYEFLPGSLIVLRLQTATLGWITLLVRVRHCKQVDGRFQLGCSFARNLSPDQLRALLL